MTEQQAEELIALMDRAIQAFRSGTMKIMEQNPSWDNLDSVLTNDELRVCLTFMTRNVAVQ